MAVYLVRGGRYGEREAVCLEQNIIAIGWVELPDLSKIKSKDELKVLYRSIYPESKKNSEANQVGQIWRFINEIKIGDHIVLPLKTKSGIAIGKVTSNYRYEIMSDNTYHIRDVEWQKIIPRSSFDQDILFSLGAFMTVAHITRNNAEARILALLHGKKPSQLNLKSESEPSLDIEEYAGSLISKRIKSKFSGHDLTRLVEAVLRAQGYKTERSPPGPDRGIDILASGGPLGFDSPRIAVQVKSSDEAVNALTLQQFLGAMDDFDADHGLFVSWGGFNTESERRSRTEYFRIRLWDAEDLMAAIFTHYDKFDEELRAELPLKKVWILVQEIDDKISGEE